MARDFILINQDTATSRTQSNNLVNYIAMLRRVIDLGNEVKDVFDHNVAAPNFDDIEPLFGVATGQGELVYNLVLGSVSELEADSNVGQILGRVNA